MREAKAAEEVGKKGRPGRLQRAADALQAWARIPRPCRDALKRADPFRVDELEMRIMDFLETQVCSPPSFCPSAHQEQSPCAWLPKHACANFLGRSLPWRLGSRGTRGEGAGVLAAHNIRPIFLSHGAWQAMAYGCQAGGKL